MGAWVMARLVAGDSVNVEAGTYNQKLNIGKACIRFQRADELALDAIGEIVASTPLEQWVAIAQAARRR